MERNLRPLLLELIGTFALVFVSAGAICVNYLAPPLWQATGSAEPLPASPQSNLLIIALAAGFIYAVALAITVGPGSGYLNPAIPVMLWVFKRIETMHAAGLLFAQLLGAAIAGGLLRLIFWFREDMLHAIQMGTPHLNLRAFDVGGVTPRVLLSGIGLELVLTFLITFILFATLIDPRPPRMIGTVGRRWACLWVGLALAAATFASYPLTGAALNPARWFGTVVWEHTIPSLQSPGPFRDQVVYWFGPIAGALLAGLIYLPLFMPAAPEAAAAPVAPATRSTSSATASRSRK